MHLLLCYCRYETSGENHKLIVNVMEQKGKHILKCQKIILSVSQGSFKCLGLLMWLMCYLWKDIHRQKVWQ